MVVGKTDAFEREYMEKFRVFASQFGEFVRYEHDRGARDIGLHLTHKLSSGSERLSTALCWFQMKGIMSSTLSAVDFDKKEELKISFKVDHLRYWYLQPMPTYLALYIESVDTFFVLNLQKYVSDKWGNNILNLDQETATVYISKESVLDNQAFHLILTESDIEEWKKVLGAEEYKVRVCLRDYNLIWHIGTSDDRNVEIHIVFMDWQSKTRGQFYINERKKDSSDEWHTIREHWQYMMNVFDLERAYPYIEFFSLEPEEEDLWDDEDDYREAPDWELSNGEKIRGLNACNEYFEYIAGVRLNDIGKEMFEWIENLFDIGLIEITPGKGDCISVAPWHRRDV